MRPFGALWLLVAVSSCAPTQPPPTHEVIHLYGSARVRGVQHGKLLKSKIHSFYTTLLTASLYPYLGREQADIATLLKAYSGPRYQNGKFAYELLLDSAKSITLTRKQADELEGIAEGSGLSYDEVLVLNTFVDSVLAVRGVALAIRLSRSPVVTRVEFTGLGSDGVDNDGDGLVDEAGEGVLAPFLAGPAANAVEVPVGTAVKVTMVDPDGIDQDSVRLTLNGQLFTNKTPALTFETSTSPDAGVRADGGLVVNDALVVTLQPPGGLAPATVQTLVVSAGDANLIHAPPPDHLSFMRDEELLFTVKGVNSQPWEVRRPLLDDGRSRPPPIAFAVTRGAALGGETLLAHHFALLDANTAHKHTVVLVHHPDDGSPAYATVGWAGVIYGFAGMSARGVGYACNPSDTLDNSVVGSLIPQLADLSTAVLKAKGVPVGLVARRVLETSTTADEAMAVFQATKHVYGWNCVVADSAGSLRSVEVDSDAFSGGQSVFVVTPTDRDVHLQRVASKSDDDLIAASAYQSNTNDIITINLAGQRVVPQKIWSSFFYRSLRVVDAVKRKLTGPLDVPGAERLLGDAELVDKSDSMTAAVMELKAHRLHFAIGQVPATSAPFETLDLNLMGP